MTSTTESVLDFECCDTTWRIGARGPGAATAVAAAKARVHELERVLNAFDPSSRVSELARTGRVRDPHVARLVRRGLEYRHRTGGVFDVARGTLERRAKAFIRGEGDGDLSPGKLARYAVRGESVAADAPLDLNGLAKGYIVDEAQRVLARSGVEGFVDGGGDIAHPTGPVGIMSPHAEDRLLGVIDTRWNVATSGGSKRRRGPVDHLYDAREGRIGALHEQVTVVAARDCLEADALATTLSVLPLPDGQRLIDRWPGAEALWVEQDGMFASKGFGDHVWTA